MRRLSLSFTAITRSTTGVVLIPSLLTNSSRFLNGCKGPDAAISRCQYFVYYRP